MLLVQSTNARKVERALFVEPTWYISPAQGRLRGRLYPDFFAILVMRLRMFQLNADVYLVTRYQAHFLPMGGNNASLFCFVPSCFAMHAAMEQTAAVFRCPGNKNGGTHPPYRHLGQSIALPSCCGFRFPTPLIIVDTTTVFPFELSG